MKRRNSPPPPPPSLSPWACPGAAQSLAAAQPSHPVMSVPVEAAGVGPERPHIFAAVQTQPSLATALSTSNILLARALPALHILSIHTGYQLPVVMSSLEKGKLRTLQSCLLAN